MRLSSRCVFLGSAAAVVAAGLTFATPVLGQTENLRTILRIRVKPDRVGDFRAGVKEYNAVLTKANYDKASTWWRSLSGPSEFVLVRYHAKYAELDQTQDPKLKDVSADLARILARLYASSDSAETIVDEIIADISLPRPAEIPKMIRSLRTRVKPEHTDAYLALIKSEIVPAVKKSGIKTYLFARTRFGAPSSEFRSATALDKWADLDGPLPIQSAMGADAYQRFLAKLRPMLVESEYNIYVHQADMSYQPPR